MLCQPARKRAREMVERKKRREEKRLDLVQAPGPERGKRRKKGGVDGSERAKEGARNWE